MSAKSRFAVVLVAGALAALAVASGASAATWCVNKASDPCPADYIDAHGSLTDALSQAASTNGSDTILIGPGTFEPNAGDFEFHYPNTTPTGAVAIVGAGRDQTVLTAPGGGTLEVLRNDTPTSSIAHLTVALPPVDAMTGIFGDGLSIDDVGVTIPAGATRAIGIEGSDETIQHADVSVASASPSAGILLFGGSLRDSSVAAPAATGIRTNGDTQLRRVTATGNTALEITSGAPDVRNTVLLARGPDAVGLDVHDSSGQSTATSAYNLTIANVDGTGATRGVSVHETANQSVHFALYESIVSGFATTFRVSGDQSLLSWDFLAGGAATSANESGAPAVNAGAHHYDGDPRFVDPSAGDYRLRPDSPAIDRYFGAVPAETGPDRNGDPRAVHDSDGDGNPEMDLGAYEYQFRAPVAAASASPAAVLAGSAVTFSAGGSSDADGDPVTYSWSFDDGSSAGGAEVSHAFSSPGIHHATVTVTDTTSLSSSATATVTVNARPATTPSSGNDAPAPRACSVRKTGTRRANRLTGTALGDLLRGMGGNDRLSGKAGDDCLFGGTGNDRLDGGPGKDTLDGGPGNDKLVGGKGKDRFSGGPGRDTIDSRDGIAEAVDCGPGRDSVRADKQDKLRGCEHVKRH